MDFLWSKVRNTGIPKGNEEKIGNSLGVKSENYTEFLRVKPTPNGIREGWPISSGFL